jgi:hypothetical protein
VLSSHKRENKAEADSTRCRAKEQIIIESEYIPKLIGSVSAMGSDNAPFEMSWNDKGAHERPVRSWYAAPVNFK